MCKCVCTALWVALLAAPVAAANDWRRWISQAADSLSHASRAELSLPRVDGGERLSPAELEAPLLGARLSWLAYAEKRREVEAGLALLGSGMELVRFSPQRDSRGAQWLVARDAESGTLWVAFRGTASLADVVHDLMAAPEQTGAGDAFHSGFLRAARAAAEERREAVEREEDTDTPWDDWSVQRGRSCARWSRRSCASVRVRGSPCAATASAAR